MSMTRNEILIALADGKALEVLRDGKWNDVCHPPSKPFSEIVEWAERHTSSGVQYRIKRTAREWWVNLYGPYPVFHTTKEAASRDAVSGRDECVHVREVLE